jgi:DNA-binding MarR family transcriptional regulator
MEAFGLKGMHAGFLRNIGEEPGISQDRLAQRIGVDKSNIARQAAFLEEEGFLRREPSKSDKRVLCLYPTDKTLALLPGLLENMEQSERALLAGLTEQEAEQFAALLRRICAAAEQEGADGKIG